MLNLTRSAPAIRSGSRASGAAWLSSKTEPLSLERIAQVAPSIMATDAHSSRSSRYTYIPTIQICEHLQKNGFGIFSVMQSGARDIDKRNHTKHLIRFRPLGTELVLNQVYPEMVLLNSHDGTSAYQLFAGLLRLVCANGMTVSAGTIGDYRVRHSGDILGGVSEAVELLRHRLPLIGPKVEQFQKIRLELPEATAFANAALTVRYGSVDAAPVPASQILRPRRIEDEEPTLWNTLNVVQESLIRGGDRYTIRGRRGVQRRTTGAVNSVDGNNTINRALWQLTEEMAKLKS